MFGRKSKEEKRQGRMFFVRVTIDGATPSETLDFIKELELPGDTQKGREGYMRQAIVEDYLRDGIWVDQTFYPAHRILCATIGCGER